MIDEKETSTETSSTEEFVESTDLDSIESMEDSILNALEEVTGGETQTDGELSGSTDPDAKAQLEASEAARILNKAKGSKGKRKVIEGADLKAPNTKELKTEPAPSAPKYDPPARFGVNDKEWFNKQPPEVQRNVADAFRNIEAHATKVFQDLQREKEEVSQIRQITRQYAPNWHARGITEVQAIAEFAALDAKLIENPLATVDGILERIGITPEQVFEYRRSGGRATQPHPPAQPTANPQQNYLTEDRFIQKMTEWQQMQQRQQATQAGQAEVNRLANTVGQDGRYVYPELHDPAQVERVKPLVDAIWKIHPNLSAADVTKEAISYLRQRDGSQVGNPSPSQPRLSRDQNEIAKVRSAAVSVRPRGNGTISTSTAAKPGETYEESILRARAELMSH